MRLAFKAKAKRITLTLESLSKRNNKPKHQDQISYKKKCSIINSKQKPNQIRTKISILTNKAGFLKIHKKWNICQLRNSK